MHGRWSRNAIQMRWCDTWTRTRIMKNQLAIMKVKVNVLKFLWNEKSVVYKPEFVSAPPVFGHGKTWSGFHCLWADAEEKESRVLFFFE